MKDPMELVVGDNLEVVYIGGTKKYYRIRAIDNMFLRDEHSAITTGSHQNYTAVTNLNPPVDQLYWIFGIEIDHNVVLSLKQPAATNRWGTNRSPTGGYLFDLSSPVTSPKKIDLWIAEDYQPSVRLANDTNISITPVLWWIGLRFAVSEIIPPTTYTTVKIGGIPE